MFNNHFYKTLEEAIKDVPVRRDGNRNELFDITNAVCSFKKALKILPEYLNNLSDLDLSLEYLLYTSGSQIALNYYLQNPKTPEKEEKKIINLIEIVFFLTKIRDKYKKKKRDKEFLKIKMEEGLKVGYRDSKDLLLKEIERWDLFSYLDNVKSENRSEYLSHVLGISSNKDQDLHRIDFLLNLYFKKRNQRSPSNR